MKAIISTTYDDNYLFYLPIVTWAWNKLGVDVVCMVPDVKEYPQAICLLINRTMKIMRFQTNSFTCPTHKEATYAQCSRLYACCLDLPNDEVLITGDIDMAVFNKEFFEQLNDGNVHVVGADLVPAHQYPMCFIAMSVKTWRDVMWIQDGETSQHKLDQLLGHLDCDHFRGNYWAKDQEEAWNHIVASVLSIIKHMRASPGTQFATRRADRDGWPEVIPPDIIDAHLPRPGYTPENFAKILNLFQAMYPNENFDWMVDYRNEYIKLINQ